MPGKLILVGTPIGNLSDFSPRAVQALRECDFIAAEDTRVTLKLLNHFEIKKPMVSYFEHNKRERGIQIVERIKAGETCCLVTDAGMPAISDPGEDIVALCYEEGISVGVVPGPSALIAALAVSGIPTGRFTFEGFLSMNRKNRREHLESLINERRTMIFYEAPHKLPSTLNDLLSTLGDRRIAIVRELTKVHEEVIRTTLSAAVERFKTENPRGEIVLVVEGAAEETVVQEYTIQQAVEIAKNFMDEGMSASEAAKQAAAVTGIKKGEIYRGLNKLK
ncbi:MAG TPA: 16S rRNA (cytidine(1402)-2'-O)-methyltransferase [Clostridiales bacterium]|nr:16S rRNA (cytidine(1402)-2'-O)-methyltransferase [Clostridiales bacterium]